jgi:hypothetical protein
VAFAVETFRISSSSSHLLPIYIATYIKYINIYTYDRIADMSSLAMDPRTLLEDFIDSN